MEKSHKRIGLVLGLISLLLSLSGNASAFCFQAAGERYQVDPVLLEAMAVQESGLNPRAINTNRDKAGKAISTDYGVMQINSRHIPKLVSMGVITSKEDLLNNACLNVQIGAWILATHLQTCGVNWSCLGSYNAGFAGNNEQRRMLYAKRIYGIYNKLLVRRPS
ncbi:lytic transglycosylase (plasmid) [Yersinia similis]|uniref:Lytic transglycosylase n=1 Tax=Yersinia similis TaxID=367190 RepID=A0ABM5Q4S1_9GAMM|nr:lytic transglycosylase domain-containing protein [Yersinia similis]AHK22107.1 lytic transglycosylase [Yersinia similis]CFQ66672.1 transglycosylase SLT domain-containing protein [Yersinia similis]CNB80598.1 transglycosylase SLT domain-containing protein [Yersinia similis]